MCIGDSLILFNNNRCFRTKFSTLTGGHGCKMWRKTAQGGNKWRAASHTFLARFFGLVAFIWKFSFKNEKYFYSLIPPTTRTAEKKNWAGTNKTKLKYDLQIIQVFFVFRLTTVHLLLAALYYFVAHVSFAFIFRCFLNVCCCSKRMEILIYSIFSCPQMSNLNKFLHVHLSRLIAHDVWAQ